MTDALAAGALLTPEKEEEKAEDGKSTAERYCFVCTGNTCRSPMAAAAANDLLGDRGVFAYSAGLFVPFPSPISKNALIALERKGIRPVPENDYRLHMSHQLDAEMLKSADRVYGMTDEHVLRIMMAFPEYAGKIASLGVSVPDPYGGDLEEYEKTLDIIIEAVRKL
ncbi:MAG: hypothetical protein J6128_01025 [Clostridia bacterium]|nr:hypothetical protein [Clostridia bacterium]